MLIKKNDFAVGLFSRLTGATQVVIVGVGYELGADDGAGLAVARKVQLELPNIPVYLTGSAPENYTGPIVKDQPSHVIFVDAAELDSQPGALALIDKDEIKGARFSTHTLPLSSIMDYFEMVAGAKSFAIGIQPFQEGFGEELSQGMLEAVDYVASSLIEVLRHSLP